MQTPPLTSILLLELVDGAVKGGQGALVLVPQESQRRVAIARRQYSRHLLV
jgi:hypothetical protein